MTMIVAAIKTEFRILIIKSYPTDHTPLMLVYNDKGQKRSVYNTVN